MEGTTDRSLTAENTRSLRFFLAMTVVMCHAASVFGIALPKMLHIIVCAFFFLSGYGLHESLKNKEGYLRNFVPRRYPALLIPYFICYTVMAVVAGIFLFSYTDIPRLILDYVFLFPLHWFVMELLIFYTIFYFVFLFARGTKALVAVTVLCTASALILTHQYGILYGASFMGFPFGIFFSMFGAGRWIKRNNKVVIVALLALLAVLFPIYEYTWGLPFVLLIISLRMFFFERYEGSRVHRAISKCGSFSYELFLIHWTFLLVIERYTDWLPLKIALAAVIPCLAAYPVYRLSRAVLNKYNKALDRN